jgi:hypothetical protein
MIDKSLFLGSQPNMPTEQRLGRLEDLESIRNLKSAYAFYCDDSYDADGFRDLFIKDSKWESNAFGVYNGIEEIATFIRELPSQIHFALHYMVNPLITFSADGNSASGRWILIEYATMAAVEQSPSKEPEAVVITCTYNDDFVRTPEGWRFKTVRANFHNVSAWDLGWVKQPFRG